MDPAPNRTGMCGQGGTGTVPVFTDRSLVEVGARLYPRGIATTTPQHFTVASGQACANPGQEFSAHRAKRDARIRTAPSPDPSGLSWWTLRRLHAPVPRVHLFVSLAGPTPSDGAGTSRLHKGPLATLPGTSRVRLPPASPPCCDRTAVQVSHLHSIDQRLTAHTHVVHPRGSRLDPVFRPGCIYAQSCALATVEGLARGRVSRVAIRLRPPEAGTSSP